MFHGRIILIAAQETTEIRIFYLKQVDFQRSPEVAVSFLLKILRYSSNEMGRFQAGTRFCPRSSYLRRFYNSHF